jgi:hypothetical protein
VTRMNTEELRALPKSQIARATSGLGEADVDFLVQQLSEKDDVLRYNAFLLLQANSPLSPQTYAHWTVFEEKLASDNSYQRGIGLMLIAENVRWDKEGKFDSAIGKYFDCCMDEKFITARQAIQGLVHVVEATEAYNERIRKALSSLKLEKYKENQQKLLKKDISVILQILDKKM